MKHPHTRIWAMKQVQKNHCYLCGEPLIGRRQKGHTPRARWTTQDHVLPVAKGGKKIKNFLLAHQECNHKKGNRHPYPCETLAAEYCWLVSEEIMLWSKANR